MIDVSTLSENQITLLCYGCVAVVLYVNLSYKKIGKDVMLGNIIAIGFVILIALATAFAIYYTIKEILR